MPSEENSEIGEQKKEKKYWPLALLLTLLLLGGGGYYALTGLKDTAHKLGGGSDYDQLSANSSVYEGNAAGKEGDVFGVGEELPGRVKEEASASRLNPSLFRTKDELLADASGRPAQASGSAEQAEAAGDSGDSAAGGGGGGGAAGAAMPGKLQARASFSGGGAAGTRSKGLSAGAEGFKGSGTVVGRADVQKDTAQASARKAAKGGVLESLKGAFRVSFYGARMASNDAAKSWVSRAFDATPEAETAIEYDDDVRSKLDRVNPSSIPGFLRDQDVSVAEAKHLADSEVAAPKFNKEGTEEALKRDDKSQIGKMLADMSGGMLNGLFKGVSGTGSPGDPGDGMNLQSAYGDDPGGMNGLGLGGEDGDQQGISDDDLQNWVDENGFGEECGCTKEAPCCCLPQNGQQDGAGVTDGSSLWAGPDAGDFSSGDTMWV
ncbi:MAG: hypothetical protein M0011_14880 [Elusimicrobia bacterium]|nr:hypothetical protein [Elusimicrobiota bacterium]